MIGIIETIRGISDWIEENFGEPPTTKDIQEGFDRPCTYVQPVSLTTSKESELRVDEFSVEIIRFASKSTDGYLELLNYQEKLTELLEHPIVVTKTFYVYPEEVDFELDREDMALICSFDLTNIQLVADADDSGDAPLMEVLDVDYNEN